MCENSTHNAQELSDKINPTEIHWRILIKLWELQVHDTLQDVVQGRQVLGGLHFFLKTKRSPRLGCCHDTLTSDTCVTVLKLSANLPVESDAVPLPAQSCVTENSKFIVQPITTNLCPHPPARGYVSHSRRQFILARTTVCGTTQDSCFHCLSCAGACWEHLSYYTYEHYF